MKLRNTLFAMFVLLTFASCDLFEEEGNESVTIVEITIASETIEKTTYKFLGSNETYLEEYLNVKEGRRGQWTEFGLFQIEGFKFDDGYEYCLRVRKTEFLDPPQDQGAVEYALERVLSKTHVNKSIAKVERFWIEGNRATVRGNNLFAPEIEYIESDILYQMSPPGTYKSYKFIYDNKSLTNGRIVVYTDDKKEVGVFNRVAIQGGYKFYIQIAQYRYEYMLMASMSRSNFLEQYAFIEDLTSRYISKYPYLELALAQQLISYHE